MCRVQFESELVHWHEIFWFRARFVKSVEMNLVSSILQAQTNFVVDDGLKVEQRNREHAQLCVLDIDVFFHAISEPIIAWIVCRREMSFTAHLSIHVCVPLLEENAADDFFCVALVLQRDQSREGEEYIDWAQKDKQNHKALLVTKFVFMDLITLYLPVSQFALEIVVQCGANKKCEHFERFTVGFLTDLLFCALTAVKLLPISLTLTLHSF